MADKIGLPSDRLTEKRPTTIQFRTQAFPQQVFQIEFNWNRVGEYFEIEIRHQNRDDFVITRSRLTIYRAYEYLPWVQFVFGEPSANIDKITPRNLGDEVLLFAVPGPEGRPVSEWDDPPKWAKRRGVA